MEVFDIFVPDLPLVIGYNICLLLIQTLEKCKICVQLSSHIPIFLSTLDFG